MNGLLEIIMCNLQCGHGAMSMQKVFSSVIYDQRMYRRKSLCCSGLLWVMVVWVKVAEEMKTSHDGATGGERKW